MTRAQCIVHINSLREKILQYQQRYSLDYDAFAQRIAEDEDFIQNIEANISKTWEMDLADWEFCQKGIQDWTRKLETNIF